MFFNTWSQLSYFLTDFYGYLALIFTSIAISTVLFYKIFTASSSQRKKKILLSTIFSILIVVLTYSATEAYFRYIYDASDGLGFLKVNVRWHNRHVIFNNYFFRDRDFNPEKKEGTVRIGVLGDSIAFGGGIEDVNNRFSNLLEKKLNDAGYKVEVYNLGTPGYDTEGEIKQYQKVRHLKFDILIWEYFLNDIQALEKSTGTPIIARNSKQGQISQYISDKSFLFDFLYWRLSSRYNKTLFELRSADLERYSDQRQLENHKELINQFMKSLEADNTKVIVIIFPFLTFSNFDYPAENIHQIISSHFKQNEARTIDLVDNLKGMNSRNLWASQFDSHPNEFVHNLAAEKLYEQIIKDLKIVPKPSSSGR